MFVFMNRLAWLLGAPLCFVLPACADDSAADGDGTSEASGGGTGDGSESADGTDDGSNFEPIPARGITITEVEANSGTRVSIGLNGAWVDGNGRSAYLPRDRDTLIRVLFELDEGWVPRPIEARLHLEYPDGTLETQTQILDIETNANPNFIDRGFYFGLTAENGATVPGMKYQVELWEVAPGGENLAEHINVTPTAGRDLIGFENAELEMNIVFVPINYNGTLPGLTEEDQKFVVEQGLLQHNPLQRVNVEWHEPIAYNQTISDLGQLLPVMSQLRQNEGRGATNWYYAALVKTGGGGVNNVAGIAYVVGAQPAADRVSANVWWRTESSSDTIVHEVGHNQGFSHVFCAGGGSTGNDPNYPDPAGYIRERGFGIRDFQVRPPTQFDYMTYCGPSWVSDWTWNRAYTRIQTLTSYDNGGATPPSTIPVLKGLLYEDGRTEWWTGDGSFDPEESSGNYVVQFDIDGQTLTQPAKQSLLSDDRTRWIEVPLPDGGVDALSGLRLETPDRLVQVSPSEITVNHTIPESPEK